MHNHYFDITHPLHPYTHSLPANPGTMPPANALRKEPPTTEAGYHPAEQGGAWIIIEDHCGEEGYVNGEPYTIKDYGPYPEGWSADPPPPTLEKARESAIALLMQKRLAVEYAGPLIEVDGERIRFPSDVKDETRLNSLAGLFAADPELQIPDWKVADGVYVTMTAPLLHAVKTAGFAHIAACFSVERVKREQIEALDSAEAVNAWLAANLDAGWPA